MAQNPVNETIEDVSLSLGSASDSSTLSNIILTHPSGSAVQNSASATATCRLSQKIANPNSSICAIEYLSKGKSEEKVSTGFLVQKKIPSGRILKYLITNLNGFSITTKEDVVDLNIEFPDKSIRNMYITPDCVEEVSFINAIFCK